MKQRLCIGILNLSDDWKLITDHLGLWCEEIDFENILLRSYSVIILNDIADPEQQHLLRNFLENGGAILEVGKKVNFSKMKHLRSRSVTTIFNYSDHEAFQHITYLDLHTQVELHKTSILFDGLIHLEFYEDGFLGYIGVDVPNLIKDTHFERKRFPGIGGKDPDEIVSRVSKNQLIEAFNALLKELHIQRSLPYIQKWTSPDKKPVFCFRIDSDYGDKFSIRQLNEVVNNYKIPATWFLHVKAHEDWLSMFKTFEKQEIAVHGYEHGTTKSPAKMTDNIQKALLHLDEETLFPDGFCAPYGIWNEALRDSLGDFNFKYTSEFTMAYDSTPIKIQVDLPLQIPIHPICTGSLRRQQYSLTDMREYFLEVLHRKFCRFEPVLFYHHPMQPGLEAMESVFEEVNNHDLTKLTFKEYAQFWESRSACTFSAYYEEEQVTIGQTSDSKQILQVSKDHTSFELIHEGASTEYNSKISEFDYSNTYLPTPEYIEGMQKNDLKLLKTSLLDWKNRNRL